MQYDSNFRYLVEQYGGDEIIERESLVKVGVIYVKKQEGKDKDDVLPRQLGVGAPEEFHADYADNKGGASGGRRKSL